MANDEHTRGRIDEEAAEQVGNPAEFFDQQDAEPDHQSTQDEGAEDPPEEHPVLLGERHPEIAEHHRDDEDVVDRKRILDHVAG